MNLKQPLEKYKTIWAITLISVITCTVVPARIYNWPSSSSPDWDWVLIILELMIGIGILAQLENKRLTDKDEIKKRRLNILVLFAFVTGSLVIAHLIGKIELKDIITIIVLFGTVLVTAEYANDTKKIAEATKEQSNYSMKLAEATKISSDASVKLAEATKMSADASVEMAKTTEIQANASVEMTKSAKEQTEVSIKTAKEIRNQRYDMFRPVIDIKINAANRRPTDPVEFNVITYSLSNVGLGPSIDGYSFKQFINGDIIKLFDLETIPAGDKHPSNTIRLEVNELPVMFIVYYRDIYGRFFVSQRKISQGEKDRSLIFEILKHRKLDKDEDKDIIKKVWPTLKSGVTND